MKRIKRFISVLLIVSMVWNTNAIYVFADGMQNVTLNASGENKNQSDELKNNSLDATKNKDDSKNNSSDNIDETSTTVNESTTESTNESETTAESTTETSVDESETTKSTEETTTTIVVTETINIDIDKLEEENTLELATISDAKENKFLYGNEDEASMSELRPLRRFVDDVDQYLVDMEDDYVAPKSSYERGLRGTDPSTTIPSSWDSREHYFSTPDFSYVPPIRLQSPYGICWAFSSIGMIETSIRKKGYVSTEDQSNLSELALAYFVYDLENVTNKSDYDNLGGIAGHDYHFLNKPAISNPSQRIWSQCGGNMINSTKMLSAYLGAVIEDVTTEYSNDGTRNQAMLDAEDHGLPDEYAFKKNAFVANNIQYINRTDTNAIKQAIMDNGSVGFAYYSEPSVTQKIGGFDYWADSPALHWEDGKSYFHSQNRVESDGRPMTNHAVMIVGWDDNIPKEKFYYGGALPEEIPDYDLGCYVYRKPPSNEEYNAATYKSSSNGAWLVRNSWGLDKPYLSEGYFYIPYDEPSLSETFYSIDAIKADTYKYNYHYDTTGAVFSYAPYSENTQFANIFKVSGEDDTQVLKAVNVGVDTADAEYDIKIYTKSTSMSYPMDGDLATTKRASNKVAGFYTFELDQTVTLTKGSYFSIVIEPVSTNVEIFTDFTDYSGGYYYTYNEVELGQSYYKHKSQPNSYWRDINSSSYAFIATTTIGGKLYGNSWRIKGLASPDTGVPAPAEGYYVLSKDWFDGSTPGIQKNEVESITILKFNEAVPTGADVTEWDLPSSSNGLKGYTKGKDIYIFAPADVPIKLPADSSFLFSGNMIKVNYTDNEHLTVREKSIEVPSPADGTTYPAYEALENINGLNKLNTEDVTDMQGMFLGCRKLEAIDLSTFNTSNVLDMSLMFANCFNNIDCLDLSSFNTSEVTSFNQMFNGIGAKEVKVSSFDTSNAISMAGMFLSFQDPIYPGIEKLDISNFNTSNVRTMLHMISAYNLASVSVASFDTRNVTSFEGMFYEMPKLTELDISSFDTTSATDMRWMFNTCTNLKTIKAGTSFVAKGITENMFDGCTSLVGGKGTSYKDENPKDGTYARIDKGPTSSAPGYFTGDDMDTDIVTVTFDLDGKGTNFTRSVTRGTAITEPTAPTYTGYNFVHWYEEGTSDTVAYNFSQVLPTDAPATKRLIAKWTAKTYTINYNAGDGATVSPASFTKTYGTAITTDLAVPSKAGHTFDGWYTTSGLNTVYDKSKDDIYDENKTTPYYIYAKWTAKTYTINYNANDGTITGDTSFTKTYGTAYSGALATPKKTGYDFGGWYKDNGTFTNEYNKNSDDIYVEGQTDLYYIYAKWNPKTYTINYYAGDGATVSPTSFTKTYGTAITTDLAVPSKAGYTFDNWYKESTFDNLYDKSTDDIYDENKTTAYTIYAKFTPNQYTVDYNLVGVGATKPSPIPKTYGTPLAEGALQAPTNIPSGYEFLGWFRSYDSTTGNYGTEWIGADDLTTGTTTQVIYAKWKRAIVYNVLKNGVDIGATSVPSKEITGPTTYKLPNTTATGYIFGGWYREAACTNLVGAYDTEITVSDPTTFYAKWTAVSYKIYYKNVDGSSITYGEYVTKTYGSTTTLNTAPTKTGYVFNGWFTDDVSFNNSYDGTTDIASTQDDDKNIYAKWTANEYQVNYNLSGISATEPSTPITKKYGTALTSGTLKDPTNIPTGYTFAGWYKESTFTNEWTGADDLTTGTTAQTIYARWKARITYNANGHGTAPAAVDVLLNATTPLPSIANVTGYTFDTTNSWYDGSDTSTATLIGAANSNYTVTTPKELFAKWNEEEYDITYDKKDGNWTGTAPASKRKYSEEVTLPVAADIAKNDGTNDYVFKGWYTEDGSASTWDETKKVTKINSNTVAPAGGHKFYARWNPAWKITFNMLSHGTKPADVVAEQGTKVPTADVPTNPIDTGYIFSGWYKNYDSTVAEFDNRYTNPFNFSTDTVTANMTLFAKWKPISYTIRYNANGGIVSKNSDTKVYNTNLTLVVPTREGYDFDAWYQNYDSTTDTFTDLYDGTTNISTTNADTKDVYAKWVAHQYTVDYDLGGVTGAVPPTSTITKTYGKPLAVGVLQNPSVIPSGYEFLGWFKESTYVNQWTGEDDLTTGTTTQTIYAKWKRAIVFSVLYNGNDIGATVPTSIEITAASTINLPSTTATGYTFGGWYNSATDFSDANRVGGASDPVNVSVPTTFYAKWTPIQYDITYNALGGNLPGATTNPFTKTYGVPATLVNPTYDGYDFAGWYSGYNSGTKVYSNPFDGSTDISTDGTGKEIYAKWTPHKYNINYELSGHATAMSATEKTYGVPYTPVAPSGVATGYVFDGWFKESTFTTPYNGDDLTTGTDPQTIYARWKATVTYYVNGHGTVSPTSVDVILGNTTQLPSLTNVEGYTFDITNSWYNGSDISTATLIGAANSNYTVNAPKNLYARWNENEWTIDYVKGTGADWATSYNPVDAGVTKRKYSEERILPVALNITKAGHTFLGWYKQGDTSETIITKIPMNTDSAVTVVAKWSENIYNITLNENGGTYVSTYSKPLTRKYSDPATLPTNADIKKTGHRLVGWYEKSDYSGTAVTAVAANTAEHKTYYARWTPETYEVRLHENGGTINEGNVTSYTYGTGATLPTNVTKSNSVFKGWWTLDGTTTGNWGSEVKTIGTAETEEKDYYAKWAESYVITFHLSSGTTHPAALIDIANLPSSQNIESGGVVTKPVDPSATNFEFKGWFTDDTFGTEYNFATLVTGTKTIYAKWANATTWDVTFDLLSGAVHPAALTDITNAPEAQHIVNGNVATKPVDPSAVGYKFIGWFTDNTFTSTYNYSTVITGVKTIYGKWELQKYSITYILNSATWVDESTIVKEREYGTPVTLPVAADMTRYGYVFNGWYENERFEGSQVLNIAGNVAEDKTFYARWSPDVNTRIITFNDNYSGATGEQAFILGEDTSIRTNVFTRAGYTFLRWKDISGNVYSSTNQLTGDIVLYAEWQKNPTPSPSNNNNNRPSDSNKDERGSTRGVGPISQTTTQQQQQQNLLEQQQNAAPQAVVSTVKSDQVFVSGNTANWSYDPINNTWKLSAFDLGGVPRNASNGFFVLNKITTVVVNNVVVPKIVNDTYYFDNKGNMVTGWVKSGDNKWYFFETAKTLDEGKLIIGWKNIGGGWYFFDSNDGSMMVNRTTPDGYKLGSDGRWIS